MWNGDGRGEAGVKERREVKPSLVYSYATVVYADFAADPERVKPSHVFICKSVGCPRKVKR